MVLRGDGEDRRFFLVQHVNGGHWDHPKGHPEAGEGPLEAARREIREEGGMEVDFIGDFSFEARWTLPDGRPKRVIYYLARARGKPSVPDRPEVPGGPKVPGGPEAPKGPAGPKAAPGGPDEILSRAWLPFEEAVERITYPSGRDVLEAARRYLEGPVPGK